MVLGWNNPSVGHVYDAVGYAVHRRVVGHDDECLSEVAAQVGYERAYLVAVCGVETSCRLVGKHYLRTVDQSAGYGCALTFSDGLWRRRSPSPRCASSSSARAIAFFFAVPAMRAGIAAFSTAVNSGRS